MHLFFSKTKPWMMQSVILVSWEIVECCLREPYFSGGRM